MPIYNAKSLRDALEPKTELVYNSTQNGNQWVDLLVDREGNPVLSKSYVKYEKTMRVINFKTGTITDTSRIIYATNLTELESAYRNEGYIGNDVVLVAGTSRDLS